MELRKEFVLARLRGDCSVASLCEQFGVSRKTGYKWLRRYDQEGTRGLEDRSRAPRRRVNALSAEKVAAIVEVRRERPHWGPKKLRWQLERRYPGVGWPAPSTIGEVLRREGSGDVRTGAASGGGGAGSGLLREPKAPNDIWGIDFKGWFRTRDGMRCDPLTVTDLSSRFILSLVILPIRTEEVRQEMETLFECYGAPGGPALGQRDAVRGAGGWWPVAVVGGLGEGGDPVGADRSGEAVPEWISRADARHAEEGDDAARSGDGGGAAGAVRPVSGGFQRAASARGAGSGGSGDVLPSFRAGVSAAAAARRGMTRSMRCGR